MYSDILHSSIVYIESVANDLFNKSKELVLVINNVLDGFERILLSQSVFNINDKGDPKNNREEKILYKLKEIIFDNKGRCDSIVHKYKEAASIVDSQTLNNNFPLNKYMQLMIEADLSGNDIFNETNTFSKNLYGIDQVCVKDETTTLLKTYEEYRKITQELYALCGELLSQAKKLKEELECYSCDAELVSDNPFQHSFNSTKIEAPTCPQCAVQSKTDNGPGLMQPSLSRPVQHNANTAFDEEKAYHNSKPEIDRKKGILGFIKRKKNGSCNDDQPASLKIDNVQFSAVFSNQVLPGKYLSASIVMYEDAFQKVVEEIQNSYGKNVKKTQVGYKDVERGSSVRVILYSDDVIVEDNLQEQQWCGKYLNFEFAVKIPTDFSNEQILFTATIYFNDIVASKLKLIVDCIKKQKQNIYVTRNDITSAFVSYASQDRSRVAAIIQGMKKARSDLDIFFDVENLHSGDYWEKALKQEIENRDVLFLCWSPFARASKWVETEWKYALSINGIDSIEPVPLVPPSKCPPPDELKSKHFNDKILLYQEKSIDVLEYDENVSYPCIVRCKTKEIVSIDKPIFRIGKEKSFVDYYIGDNTAISRSHASIITKENQYYIVDTNSTNHTFVNGTMLESNIETAITHQTKIRLANEDFLFLLC